MIKLFDPIIELLFHFLMWTERRTARKLLREKPAEYRVSWIHRREAAEGLLGLTNDHVPETRCARYIRLSAWYVFYYIVWLTRRYELTEYER